MLTFANLRIAFVSSSICYCHFHSRAAVCCDQQTNACMGLLLLGFLPSSSEILQTRIAIKYLRMFMDYQRSVCCAKCSKIFVANKFEPIRSLHFTTRPAKHLLLVLLRAKHLQLKSNAPSYYPCTPALFYLYPSAQWVCYERKEYQTNNFCKSCM